MKAKLGGDRIGSGGKMEVHMKNYERSTHDLSYIWRSTMASGTLVPFINELMLPGDSFDINLDCEILTSPTIGPLFGSYKVQLDVYQIPIRLYNAGLHMNMLNIGMEMDRIKFPLIKLKGTNVINGNNIDTVQINPSSIYAYMGIRGIGSAPETDPIQRDFNAIPILAYWDIYKNYYANKQEGIGYVIHNDMRPVDAVIEGFKWVDSEYAAHVLSAYPMATGLLMNIGGSNGNVIEIATTGMTEEFDVDRIKFGFINQLGQNVTMNGSEVFMDWHFNIAGQRITANGLIQQGILGGNYIVSLGYEINQVAETNGEPKLEEFDLDRIDKTRLKILQSDYDVPFMIDANYDRPYGLGLRSYDDGTSVKYSATSNQEGLGVKTYQSDIFNNWLDKEWIDGVGGVGGINNITKIDTTGDSFTINEFLLAKKIYDMLNRIAVSGGTYDDWLDATYTHERVKQIENPVYMGGLSKELVFQEVVSNSASNDEPLGTLAGRGKLSSKHKGGKVRIKVDEPSYCIGIVSLTPRLDYSQGNKWHMNLRNMNELHKPALDGIGFQNLMSDQLAWFQTRADYIEDLGVVVGKQPAWMNYMTNVNVTYGNFADRQQQMYMTLNRRYEHEMTDENIPIIKDLTTYIDPAKFNNIFADTRRDAQNFWTQIKVDISARRKMSAKIMPNL